MMFKVDFVKIMLKSNDSLKCNKSMAPNCYFYWEKKDQVEMINQQGRKEMIILNSKRKEYKKIWRQQKEKKWNWNVNKNEYS